LCQHYDSASPVCEPFEQRSLQRSVLPAGGKVKSTGATRDKTSHRSAN